MYDRKEWCSGVSVGLAMDLYNNYRVAMVVEDGKYLVLVPEDD